MSVGCGRPQLSNPHLSPFEESTTRPTRRSASFSRAASVSPGARAIAAGGLQSLPAHLPGGGLIGDDAGFLQRGAHQGQPRGDQERHACRRGNHEALAAERQRGRAWRLSAGSNKAGCIDELYQTRNFKPHEERLRATGARCNFGAEQKPFKGWYRRTLHNTADHTALKPGHSVRADRLSQARRQTQLRSAHQRLPPNTKSTRRTALPSAAQDASAPISINLAIYDAPEQRYCPASVHRSKATNLAVNRGRKSTPRTVHQKTLATSRTPPRISSWVGAASRGADLPGECDPPAVSLPAATLRGRPTQLAQPVRRTPHAAGRFQPAERTPLRSARARLSARDRAGLT